MEKAKIVLVALIPLCALLFRGTAKADEHASACGLASKVEATSTTDSNSIIQDGIEYYMQTDKSVYSLGEDVEILYSVKNLGVVDVEFTFGCGPVDDRCDYIVEKDGERIWDNLFRPSTMAFTSFTLNPQESYVYTHTWDMMNNNGTPLLPDDDFLISPGLYNVIGALGGLASGYEDRYVPVSVSIDVVKYVNFKDYAILAKDWMKTGPAFEGDINRDGVVDYNDLEIMAGRWLYEKLEDDTEDSYSCEGDFDASYPCSNAVDEDWDTYALSADPGATSYIYENYMIPPGIAMADFTIKYAQTAPVTPGGCTSLTDYWDGSTWTELECTALSNYTSTLTVRIPDDGLIESTLQLRTRVWKGTGLIGSGSGMYYEGKVIWYYGN